MGSVIGQQVAQFDDLAEAHDFACEVAKRLNARLFVCKRSGRWVVVPPSLAKVFRAARDQLVWS